MTKKRLTKSIIDAVKPGPEDIVIWDKDVPGFGYRVRTSGHRTYILKYRTNSGVQRKLTLGAHGAITCDQARALARQGYMEAKDGKDPSAERQASRLGNTMADLFDRYMADHAPKRKKQSSIKEDAKLIRRYLRPNLGPKRIEDVSRKDISDLHNKMSGVPYQANRAVALLSHMFTVAIRWGLRTDNINPCKGIERFPEKARERHLSLDEVERLFAALDRRSPDNPFLPAYFKLLAYTGARRSEILDLDWSHVDLKAKSLRLPDSKTGAKSIILTDVAAAILDGLPRLKGQSAVFPGRSKGKRMAIDKFWFAARADAGLPGVRIHDLRHTFASLAIAKGVSLPVIGGLLGHKSVATTARYSHLIDHTLRAAAEQVAGAISGASNPSEPQN